MAMRNSLVLLGLSFLVLAGCGSGEPAGGDATANPTNNQGLSGAVSGGQVSGGQVSGNQTLPVKSDNRTPEQVVTIFLESLRDGNDERMKQMLTGAARQNYAINASKSDSTFEVFEAQIYEQETETLAYVPATWTINDKNSQTSRVDHVKWALRKKPEGWRVAGLAMLVPELDNKWELLNFEDQEKMEAKQREVWPDVERQRSEQPAAGVARNPSVPNSPTQK